MKMAASPARLFALTTLLTLLVGCSTGAEPRRDAGEITEPTYRGLQAYAYSSPVPPLEPTSLDGTFRREITVAQAGDEPVACRRCAPYRLDAGTTLLVLERGRFFLLFSPLTDKKVCPGCKPPGSFRASGHFVLEGDRIELFNDPNCEETRGVYSVEQKAAILRFNTIDDPCFGGIRGHFLGAYPWQAKGVVD